MVSPFPSDSLEDRLFSNAFFGVGIFGLNGQIEYLNSTLAQLLAIETLDKEANICDWVHPDSALRLKEVLFELKVNSSKIIEFGCAFRSGKNPKIPAFLRLNRISEGEIFSGKLLCQVIDQTQSQESEKKIMQMQARLLESQAIAKIGSWEFDIERNKIWWSRETYHLFGMSPLGAPPSFDEHMQKIHPDDRGRFFNMLQAAMRSGRSYDIVFKNLLPNGSSRILEAHGKCDVSKTGKVLRVHGTLQDITEKKSVETELQESKARYDLVVRGLSVGIWDWNIRMNELYLSPKLKQIIGYPDMGLKINWDFFKQIIHPEDASSVFDELESHFDSRKDFSVECRVKRRNEGFLWVGLHGQATWDSEGKPVRMAGSMIDISERKQMEEQMKLSADKAEAANTAKSLFLANMSHEIRTPMNAVMGMATLLADTELTDMQQEFVETIHTSSDALLVIINDILDFSKIEAGMLELEITPFDLFSCLEDSLDLFALKAAEKNLELLLDIDSKVPRFVKGDPTRLRQIVVNLVGNAIKFTQDGEIYLSVSLKHELAEGSEIQIDVRDTGIGISEEVRNKLFKPFTQVDSTHTRKFGGTGLGLSISRKLCESMGGSIWANSVEGEGSTFSFTIQLPEDSSRTAEDRIPEVLKGRNVLLVDDNESSLGVLSKILTQWGMKVTAEKSPRKALKLCDENTYELILVDYHMPGLLGTTFASKIKEKESYKKTPVILMGTHLDREIRQKAEDLKLHTLLHKPIKQSILLNSLRDLSGQRSSGSLISKKKQSLGSIKNLPKGLRILLVEDNVVNQRVARLLLQRLGYRPDIAANGIEACDSVERKDYDLVFMDMQMPEMDGVSATEKIRKHLPKDRQPYIVAMTAAVTKEDREQCAKVGMQDFVGKPIRCEELENAILKAGKSIKKG